MFNKKIRLFTYSVFFLFFLVFTGNPALMASERITMVLQTSSGNIIHESRPVTLNINGQNLPSPDMPPVILQNRTFVPVRHVFEALGAVVDFHEAQRRIMIAYNDSLIVMHIGQYHFNFDTDVHQMDVAPQIINDRTMVPVSFVASALGFDVGWNPATYTVSLATPGTGAFVNVEDYSTEDQSSQTTTPGAGTATEFAEPEETDLAQMSLDLSPGLIQGETNLETTVDSIIWNDDHSQFTITASSRIYRASWNMLPDGRLIVDIHHAQTNFPQSNFSINNDFLTTVRTGQNVINDLNTARVVFDLTAPMIYSITLSEDREHITVSFINNSITGAHFASHPGAESITISGTISPRVDIFTLNDPLRLVIDLPNSTANIADGVFGQGHFVSSIRYAQHNTTTTRVVLELHRRVSFTTERHGSSITIRLTDPTYRNIAFNAQTGLIEIAKPNPSITPSQIIEFDQYLQRRYTLLFPGDFSDFFGYGIYWVRQGVINNIEIVTENGMTRFHINTNVIQAYFITEDAETIFVRPVNPREKYPRIVFIDPGHGGRDPGAVHHGMRESDVNLDVALMVMEILNRDGIVRAYITRYEDVAVANGDRARMANQVADFFVSIHFNAAHGRAQGTETLYAIHEMERDLPFNSQDLATIFQTNLVGALGSVDRGIRYRPQFIVLNQTQIPAVLLEIGFLDHPDEAARIATQEYRQLAAQTIVQSIYEAFNAHTPRR